MKLRATLFALTLPVVFGLQSAAFGSTAPLMKKAGIPLATVNGDVITGQELVEQFAQRHSGHATFLGGDIEARKFLEMIIDERLFIQEAYNIGLDQDPRVVAMVEAYAHDRAARSLIQAEIEQKSAVSPEDVKAAWKKNLGFVVLLRQVAVETREEAEELRTALLHGADIDTLARSCSRAESRVNGGHVMAYWGQADPEWERVVFALEPGQLSPVIETSGGYEIVILDDHVESALPPFDKVSSQVESTLRQRKLEERKRSFSDELWARFHVVLQPVDWSPVALLHLLVSTPEAPLARWDGGEMSIKDTFSADELRMWSHFPQRAARLEIEKRVRMTVNDPVVVLEAKARKLDEQADTAKLIDKYRATVMENFLFKEHILHDVAVTDDEVRRYYEDHKSEFEEPEQRHVAQIMLATEADAKAVRGQLSSGADFAQVARKQSRDAATAIYDGNLGWITAEKVPPAFKEVMSLGIGEVSRPVKSEKGWHLIKVTDITPKRQLPLADVLEQVKQKSRTAKEQTVQKFWLEKLRAAAKIEFDDAAIRRFVADNQFNAKAAAPQHKLN